jgi:hypothetical protein
MDKKDPPAASSSEKGCATVAELNEFERMNHAVLINSELADGQFAKVDYIDDEVGVLLRFCRMKLVSLQQQCLEMESLIAFEVKNYIQLTQKGGKSAEIYQEWEQQRPKTEQKKIYQGGGEQDARRGTLTSDELDKCGLVLKTVMASISRLCRFVLGADGQGSRLEQCTLMSTCILHTRLVVVIGDFTRACAFTADAIERRLLSTGT